MKEWAKLWCCVIGLSVFTFYVFSVFLFHISVEHLNAYIGFLKHSRYFVPVLSYIHYGFIFAYAVSIATNILMDINKDES